MNRDYYHTQECRGTEKLKFPIICNRNDAWFGEAYYFWNTIDDADYWGEVSKRATGKYDVYSSTIDVEDFLNTVFNEEHYNAWVDAIEKLALKFKMELGKALSLKELNDYFREKGLYKDISGVIFQDISNNQSHYLIKGLQYKKRIQLAVFNKRCIESFVYLHTGKSISYDRYK